MRQPTLKEGFDAYCIFAFLTILFVIGSPFLTGLQLWEVLDQVAPKVETTE